MPPLALAVLIAAIQQIAAPALIFPRGFDGRFAGPSVATPSEPAGYAFAIWGVIYLGCLGFAVVQLLPRWRQHPAIARIRLPAIALFLGSTAWLLLARQGPQWGTVVTIWAMLLAAILCVLRLARTPALPAALKRWAGWPLAIYAGWLSAAAFVNSATILPAYGTGTAGLGTEGLALLMVAGAAVLALVVLRASRGALPYALAVVWALVGIVFANRGAGGSAAVMWAAAAAAALLLAALLAIRRARRRPGPGAGRALA